MTRTQVEVYLKDFFLKLEAELPKILQGNRTSLLSCGFPEFDSLNVSGDDILSLSRLSSFEVFMSVVDFLKSKAKLDLEISSQKIFEKKWQIVFNPMANTVTPILIKGESNTTVRRLAGKYLFFIFNDSI